MDVPNGRYINKQLPSVSIILLNWHGWRDTIACLDSLACLDYENYHILVVDNGSTDDSVARIHAAHPDIPILETGHNLGFSGGCNAGIRRALEDGADYVWLLNNDTTVDPQALNTMVVEAEADPTIGAVGSVIYYMDNPSIIQAWGGGKVSFWSGRAHHCQVPVSSTSLDYLTAGSILIRRHALEEVGLLDEKTFFLYWEDTDFSFRLRKAGWRLAIASQSIVFHKEHGTTGNGSPLLDFHYNESAVHFFRRYAPIPVWPIIVGVAGRLSKRVLRGEFTRFIATLHGTYVGLKK
ncbi:glycosyltransferase family 2 protein [Acidithiobacillus montserratensis]|uniref:Glycosyltransferase family 2 protein n=1 Tax=Acidithiobacillus montserratensis TaxID=2729135 RepID=A0ACD5HC43_9PROT|nr:glycosyltransferase family 2 protein [Acidithiobacillaceae bacterium]